MFSHPLRYINESIDQTGGSRSFRRRVLRSAVAVALAVLAVANASTSAMDRYQSRDGHPADHLPPYIKKVCGFGERPEWSHDGKRILFVEKPMGEVYELDLETGLIHPKTRHFHHYGFTRANYLANGAILLSGPDESFDDADRDARNTARHDCFLSVMENDGKSKPVPLGTKAAEGPAVSRKHMKIAWTHRDKQDAKLGKNHARHFVANITYQDGSPTLTDRRIVFDSHQLPFRLGNASLETQDFAGKDDRKLIFSVYQIKEGHNTDTFMVDTETGKFQNLTRSPEYYDEPEGVFPDGLHTCVEHAPNKHSAWPLCDLYKLKLDGSGRMQRLTYFSEFKGFKGTQGVVSDDGKKLCFQIGKSGDEAGVGYGFFVMDLEAAAKHLEPFRSYAKEGALGKIQPARTGEHRLTFAQSPRVHFERNCFQMPERCDRALAMDVDGDQDLDLVGICQKSVIAITLPEKKTLKLFNTTDGQMIHGDVWDADQDGDKDIVICRFAPGKTPDDYCLAWLENPGWKLHVMDRKIRGVHGLAVGDLDGDGKHDVVTANVSGPAFPLSVSWFQGGSGRRQFICASKAGVRPHYLATGDLNDDGRNDVVLGDGGGFTLFTNPGAKGLESEWPRTKVDTIEGGTNVVVADIDGDGKHDIAGSCGHGTGIRWYRNPGWEAHLVDAKFDYVHALDCGDLDGDGDTDIAAGSFGGYGKSSQGDKAIHVYLNDGAGKFYKVAIDTGNRQESYSLLVIDVDGDQNNDLLVGGRGSKNVVWYRNTTISSRKVERGK